jgi:hypothetical protein
MNRLRVSFTFSRSLFSFLTLNALTLSRFLSTVEATPQDVEGSTASSPADAAPGESLLPFSTRSQLADSSLGRRQSRTILLRVTLIRLRPTSLPTLPPTKTTTLLLPIRALPIRTSTSIPLLPTVTTLPLPLLRPTTLPLALPLRPSMPPLLNNRKSRTTTNLLK